MLRKSIGVLFGTSSAVLTYELYQRKFAVAEEKKSPYNQQATNDGFIHLGEVKLDEESKIIKGRETAMVKSHVLEYDRKYKRVVPKLFKIIHQIKEETGSPGISFAISKNGEIVMKGGIGFSDVENGVPMTSETVLRIASISKSLTSVAIGKLFEEKKLDLDQPIQTYLKDYGPKIFDGRPVTITTKQLLSHTSGIRGYFDDPNKYDPEKGKENIKMKLKHEIVEAKFGAKTKTKWNEFYYRKHFDTMQDGLVLFKQDPLIYEPGKGFEYSSLTYSLVGRIIEIASGQKFGDCIKDICNRLCMKNTFVEDNDQIVNNRARFYSRKEHGHRLQNTPYVDLSYKIPGGGLISNAEDIIKFANGMLRSYSTDNGILKSSTVQTLWAPVTKTNNPKSKYEYALGWYVTPCENIDTDDKYIIQHTGGAVGCSSVLCILPNKRPVEVSSKVTSAEDCNDGPEGIAIVLIVNMESVGLLKTAEKLADVLSADL